MYSPQLLWECTKKDSSMLRKPITPNLPWMSASPRNLTGVNSFKFSGETGRNTFGLTCVKKGIKESIVMLKPGKKIKVRVGATALSKSNKKGLASLEAALAGKFYRKDLLELAKVKYAKIKSSFKKKKAPVSSRRAPKA
eukprot:TRINITY_DN3393_c0_g2_i3.p1 TRINITY_DN3393_c0_g2~~TRINITY_DN3393_c0_g2_i3.p1  ORF type:complete len:139 (+),score=49.01 TRINITY_DN3393_c0_g2_i3:96-512(+)